MHVVAGNLSSRADMRRVLHAELFGRAERGIDLEQTQPLARAGRALYAIGISDGAAQHLVAAADAQDPLAGAMVGATGMGGPPIILYLLAGPDPIETTRANLTYFVGAIALASFVENQKSGVSSFIADQVKRWDLAQLTRLIEINIGRDLQYIRFNGMLIGGLAGLTLHAGERLIFN